MIVLYIFFGLSSILQTNANWKILSTKVCSQLLVNIEEQNLQQIGIKVHLHSFFKMSMYTIATFTLCSRPVRKALFHLMMVGYTLKFLVHWYQYYDWPGQIIIDIKNFPKE